MDFGKFQKVDLGKYICPVPGIKVLVVDGDLRCLETVSKLLGTLGYEVVTASLAYEALSIIEEKKNELHLVLVDVHLPDMGIDMFTEKIRKNSNLPYCFMTADDYLFSSSRAMHNGAKLYFKNSIMLSDLCELWKFAKWRNEGSRMASKGVRGLGWPKAKELNVTGHWSLQSAKMKERERDIGGQQFESIAAKRKRLNCIDDLRMKLLGAVKLAGINAAPNQRHQLMNEKLTVKNIPNYSQRYRQSLKQEANPIQQHRNRHSCNLNLGSQHRSQIDYDKGKWPLFFERPDAANTPPFQGYHQIYLCNCMHVHSLRTPDKFPDLEISSGEMSTFVQNQLDASREMQGVAPNTSGSGEFMNNGNGEAFVYYVDDPDEQNEMDFLKQSADDLCQQFPPLHPVLPPLDEQKHHILGPEAGKVDEIFYSSKGTQQFSDEDLNVWLSRLPRELLNDAVA